MRRIWPNDTNLDDPIPDPTVPFNGLSQGAHNDLRRRPSLPRNADQRSRRAAPLPHPAFGGDVESLLRLPGLSYSVDDSALADFLLFGDDREPAGTPYRRIRQLPPAHRLTCEGSQVRVERYWRLGPQSPIIHRYPEDYVERFRELFGTAVSDRIREPRVGVPLSGGHGLHHRGRDRGPRSAARRRPWLAARLHSHRDLLRRVEADGARMLLAGEGGDPRSAGAIIIDLRPSRRCPVRPLWMISRLLPGRRPGFARTRDAGRQWRCDTPSSTSA